MKNHRITRRLTIDTDPPTPEPIPVHQAPDPAAVEGCMLDVVRSETVVRIVAITRRTRIMLSVFRGSQFAAITPQLHHSITPLLPMLTQLSTIKSRLQILDTDTTYDVLLTSAIQAVSSRFDKETNRTLARTENVTDEFDTDETEIAVSCYPIETVTKFETKSTESEGWIEQPAPPYLIRRACVISLALSFSLQPLAFSLCRVIYTGGYVLPGTTPAPGQTPLPPDLENACVEQLAFWFMNREKQGLKTYWPKDVAYQQFATQDLLESVASVLKRYARWTL